MKRRINHLLIIRRNLTYHEWARQIRNVYDSLMAKHDWLMDDGHDGWLMCPCQAAVVLRNMVASLDDSAEWFKIKIKIKEKKHGS